MDQRRFMREKTDGVDSSCGKQGVGRRLLWLICFLCLQGCGRLPSVEQFAATPEGKAARELVDLARKGDSPELRARLAPEMNSEETIRTLAELPAKIPQGEPKSVELIGYNAMSMNDKWSAQVSFEYQFPEQWMLANVNLERTEDKFLLRGINFRFLPGSFRELNGFRLDSRRPIHYLFLGLAILLPLFMIGTAILAGLTPALRHKWLWILLSLVGFFKISLNWTTGGVGFSLTAFQLLGASIFRAGDLAPWILSLSLPIGAVFFLVRRSSLVEGKPDQQEGQGAG